MNIVIFSSLGKQQYVFHDKYTVEELKVLFENALKDNDLFKGIYVSEDQFSKDILGDIVVIIDKVIIQFYNNDISDLFGNLNEVEANVFKEATIKKYNLDLKVGFTTFDEKVVNDNINTLE